MWPNSCLPSATALVQAVHSASRGRFTLENVENHAAREPNLLITTIPIHQFVQIIHVPYALGVDDWRPI